MAENTMVNPVLASGISAVTRSIIVIGVANEGLSRQANAGVIEHPHVGMPIRLDDVDDVHGLNPLAASTP